MARSVTGACPPHHFIIESPRDARLRWEKDATTLEERRLNGVCAKCAATRDYPIDSDDDDELPQMLYWNDPWGGR
jgi:hypothetical protein